MGDNDPIERFHDLKERYDEEHGRGATLDMIEELELGSGPFNEQLTTEELTELNQALAKQIAQPHE